MAASSLALLPHPSSSSSSSQFAHHPFSAAAPPPSSLLGLSASSFFSSNSLPALSRSHAVEIGSKAPSLSPLQVGFFSYDLRHEWMIPARSTPKRHSVVAATAAEAPPLPLPKQKIRIKLRSYWTPLIEQASKQILDAAKSTNAKFMGPVPLPTKRRIFCVLRSPHVNKDSREHFEIRTHRRLIDIDNPTAQTIDALMQLDIPAGVDVEVKL